MNADQDLRWRLTVGVFGGLLGVAWFVLDHTAVSDVNVADLLLFSAAAGMSELLPIRQPGGRAASAALAVVGAAAVLGMPPPVVALIAGLGWLVARLADRQPAPLWPLLARVFGAWTLSGIAALGAVAVPATFVGDVPAGHQAAQVQIGAAIGVALALVVGLPALEAISRAEHRGRYALRRIVEAINSSWLVGLALAATAVLGALVHPVLRHWTLPTMLIPLLAARVGLNRFAVASRAYDQTIRAMSRLPEQLGTVEADHGVRVGTLARRVGLELGLDAATLDDLERAAHLHELGRIKLERDVEVTRRELALAGASVIAETASLDRVARIVAGHGDPLHREEADVRVPARIVAACCEVDRYAPDPDEQGQLDEVTVRLVREVGDLEVVGALARVLQREHGWS